MANSGIHFGLPVKFLFKEKIWIDVKVKNNSSKKGLLCNYRIMLNVNYLKSPSTNPMQVSKFIKGKIG